MKKANQGGKRKTWRTRYTGSSHWRKSIKKETSTCQKSPDKSIYLSQFKLCPPMHHFLILSHIALKVSYPDCINFYNKSFLEGNLHTTCILLSSLFISSTRFWQFYFIILPLISSTFFISPASTLNQTMIVYVLA